DRVDLRRLTDSRLERRVVDLSARPLQVVLGEGLVTGADQAELEAARAGIDDEDPHCRPWSGAAGARPGPVADVGWVLAVVARVLAVGEPQVGHLLADVG